ncbi:ribosomal protein L31e-domain-containing protein [Zopfochytrium polystomum]|nr:ribosomal protein L31e-domain-containing protein [Zopfochytrium polystomum]
MAKDQKKSTKDQAVTRECTLHLHKHVFGKSFRKRAPFAIKTIRRFAAKTMGTSDVRIDPSLNNAVWHQGIKTVPHRIRLRLSRKRNDAEDAKEKMYTLVQVVNVTSFKGLQSQTVEDA